MRLPRTIFLTLVLTLAVCGWPATPVPTGLTSGPFQGIAADMAETLAALQSSDWYVHLPIELGTTPEGPHINNLISNGTFESGNLDGWNVDGATASTAEAHTGDWSARIANTNMETIINTTPGEIYKVTAWVKIVGETGDDWGGFRLEVISWDWDELAHSGWLLTESHGSEWFKVALTFTASTEQTRVHVGYFGGPGRSMMVHVDDITAFEKGENWPPDITAMLNPTSMAGLPQMQDYSIVGDDPDGAIVRVLWDFGDGTRSLSWNGTRRVALPGSYVATVRVVDDEGAEVVETISWTATASDFPSLVVNTPAAYESTVNSASLAMSGSASGSVTSVRISMDREYVGTASGTTAWNATVPLRPGCNRILVQAHDVNGRIATVERLVWYIPSGSLRVSNVTESATSVERWEVLEVTFMLENSAATHPQFPYDPAPPPGLEWVDGITAEAVFTPDDWQTIYRRPAFLHQRYQRALKNDQEWLYPIESPVWTVRFAPPEIGMWKYHLEVREARGTAQSAERTFAVTTPTNPDNHGPVRVASLDSRYFEFADGTPFLGTGHGIGFSDEGYSYDAVDTFGTIGAGNQNFFRLWIAGHIWGSAWQPWASRTLSYEGNLPATGLTVERAYGNGLASLKLDAANPIMFQGWMSGHSGLIPGRTYRVLVRWRTEDVTGPASSGQPYGVTVKLTDWPEPGQTGSIPAVIPHVNGDTPWHVAQADFVAEWDFIPNLALILENTTGGAAYVDEIGLYEVLPGGSLGPQLLRSPRFNSHLTFDPRRGAGMDAIFAEAAQRGLYFKLVVSEKQEYLLNHLAPDGLPDKNGGHFNRGEGTPTRRLHEYYWRYLFARFGAFRSIHSWELVNEEAPEPGEHFLLTAALATQAAADGNPHLATTSTWATLAEDAWKNPDSASISYVDFHAYVRGTGWIEPKGELANDSARFFHEYDMAALEAGFDKPVVWGEQGIDGDQGTDEQEPRLANDQDGVWLHKLTWARCGPGGVYPLYWYTDHIFDKSLHGIFGAWQRFMAGIPLTNGRYEDIAAIVSHSDLRAFGQKDQQAGNAYVWIDNRQHTWRAVVDGDPITSVSGNVSIAMGKSNASFAVTWYDTETGQPSYSETLSADADGTLTLTVSDLMTDTAAKIAFMGPSPTDTPPTPTPSAHKAATPATARTNETITFTITLAGTGEPMTVTDQLPIPLTYLSATATCPGTVDYNDTTRQVIYSGTPSAGSSCVIEISTRVNTDQRVAVTNMATVDNGLVSPYDVSATVILNGLDVYLPLIMKAISLSSVAGKSGMLCHQQLSGGMVMTNFAHVSALCPNEAYPDYGKL
jgi:hypothetical protein